MPDAFTVGPLLLPTLRVGLIGSLLLGILVAGLAARLLGFDARRVRAIADISVLLGLVGARVGYVAANAGAYAAEPWSALYLWQPGYSPWAGVATGVAVAAWRVWRSPSPLRFRGALPLSLGAAAAGLLATAVVLATSAGPRDLRLHPGPVAASRGADRAVPEFVMRDLDGRVVSSRQFAGNAVLLNFWATWCAPCRREMPLLDDMHRRYAGRGLVVVGVAVGEPAGQVRAFTRQLGIDYAVWVDPPGSRVSFELFDRLGGAGFPTTYFIAPDGRVRDAYVGELARAPLIAALEALLEE